MEAADGREACARIQSDQPDVVLSNSNMPEMTGIDCLQSLRANGVTTPFGFVTSEGSTPMSEEAEAAGALFLIAKPFSAEDFESALSDVLT